MSAKLFALVKWIGGSDDKKYTVGIPVDWIKGFDEMEFRSDKFDPTESYVIEWRDKPGPPPGGWSVYDAYVIEVSNRKSVLEKKMQALDGFLSPTKVIRTNTSSSLTEKLPINEQDSTFNPRNDKCEDEFGENCAYCEPRGSGSFLQIPTLHMPNSTPPTQHNGNYTHD